MPRDRRDAPDIDHLPKFVRVILDLTLIAGAITAEALPGNNGTVHFIAGFCIIFSILMLLVDIGRSKTGHGN